jgi:hypothetical protein
MNVRMLRCVWVLLLLLHAAALCARELNDEFQVAITRSDRAWLTYAQVVNAFDSATVGYSFGEIRVLHSSKSRLRVSLVPRSGYTATYAGQSASGYDSELSRQLETDEFFAREGDSLQFFREVSVWLPCIGEYTSDPFSPSDMAALAAEPRLRYFGLGGVESILDDSRWCVRLVDAVSGEALATLDSVGIGPNGSSRIAIPYGTEPLETVRTVPLPASSAGRRVRLRIDVYRNGPTPVGMTLRFVSHHYTLSSVRFYASDGSRILQTDDAARRSDSLTIVHAMRHYDSVLASDGCVVELETALRFSNDTLLRSFLARYFDNVTVTPEELRYDARACNANASSVLRGGQSASIAVRHHLGRASQPTVDVVLARGTPGLSITLHESTTGRIVATIPVCEGDVRECSANLPQLPHGSYLVVLNDRFGRWQATALVVQ